MIACKSCEANEDGVLASAEDPKDGKTRVSYVLKKRKSKQEDVKHIK